MFKSMASLGSAQSARASSLAPPMRSPNPVRETMLEGFRQRNALLDYLFYDVKVIERAEARSIAPQWAAEGALLLVPPSGGGALTLHLTIDEFETAGGAEVATLAVAGVGSSALGSAAFARNIADAIGEPVAAVVSGYGLADLVTEALGGYFWFGALNQMRHAFEGLDEWFPDRITAPAAFKGNGDGFLVRRSRDTHTVLAMLQDERFRFNRLLGHSKGNLVISEAFYELERRDAGRAQAIADEMTIITVSARVAMPDICRQVIDVIGALDWFGGLNSRPDIAADHLVPFAWHHTNTEIPTHLPVTSTLRMVLR